MAFSHSYPWQILTKMSELKVSQKIERDIDGERLKEELDMILSEYTLKKQFGLYHDGGWRGIGLMGLNGNPYEDRKLDGAYLKTPVLQMAPYMDKLINSFPCEKVRVRLMALEPGRQIYWHYDREETFDEGNVRLHIPIITNPSIEFQISHEDCTWLPGELWYGDFSFPHRLRNLDDQTRIHLVLDLKINDYIRNLFPIEFHNQKGRRKTIRSTCHAIYQLYNLPVRGRRLVRYVRATLNQ